MVMKFKLHLNRRDVFRLLARVCYTDFIRQEQSDLPSSRGVAVSPPTEAPETDRSLTQPEVAGAAGTYGKTLCIMFTDLGAIYVGAGQWQQADTSLIEARRINESGAWLKKNGA